MTRGALTCWASLPILAVVAVVPRIAGGQDQGILEQIRIGVESVGDASMERHDLRAAFERPAPYR